MKKTYLSLFVILVMVLSLSFSTAWAAETENGVTISVSRVLRGVNSGARYYGYSGGQITAPHNRGGMLSFDLWNDTQTNGLSVTNFFIAEIGGRQLVIQNYATVNQIIEEYAEYRGQWGAAGINRVTIAIPPGVASFNFTNAGSQTGVEISKLRFIDGYIAIPGGFELARTRPPGEPVVSAGRVLNGVKTGRKYYGYSGGAIHLPHMEGGFLSFKLWNDQHAGYASAKNIINLTVGAKQDSFTQYTTSLALGEYYKEFLNEWGPAGGSDISIQVPEGLGKIEFSNSGSNTGIEISDVSFTKGAPILISFQEKAHKTTAVLHNFGRTLHGANTGRQYFGYAGGTILLPNNKGGVLSFQVWNDQAAGTPRTVNTLNINAGGSQQTVTITTGQNDRSEYYKEFMNQWGPAGGKDVRINVPAGVSSVDMNNSGSQTGIELSDISFASN
jgi:hypothetical protein